MTCRRICRELLWLTRFGEIGKDSAPHLDHLAGCHACRDEIGFDRAMVQQLRLALAERVGDAVPSPSAWAGVLDRMRRPEPQPSRLRTWALRLASGLRAGTAMAGASLALIVALNLEVVSILPPAPSADASSTANAGGPVSPDAIDRWIEAAPVDETPPADESSASAGTPLQPAEQLPMVRFGREPDLSDGMPAEEPDISHTTGPADVWQVLQVRLVPADRVGMSGGGEGSAAETATEEPEPVPDSPLDGPS